VGERTAVYAAISCAVDALLEKGDAYDPEVVARVSTLLRVRSRMMSAELSEKENPRL
jgi:hypothetical protein